MKCSPIGGDHGDNKIEHGMLDWLLVQGKDRGGTLGEI